MRTTKILIEKQILPMAAVRSLTSIILDEEFVSSTRAGSNDHPHWCLSWGWPPRSTSGGTCETGFFWDAMHIDPRGLYQHSSLNTHLGRIEVDRFQTPESAGALLNESRFPNSKYRQPRDSLVWNGAVFACQNPNDRSVHSTASTEEWWRFLADSCKFYGSQLLVKLHPWNSGATKARIEETAYSHGCEVGHYDLTCIENCDHVVLFNSTFAVDCFAKSIPVKQGAPGYFEQTGAVTYCAGDPTKKLNDTCDQAIQLLDFLIWKYCFPIDMSIDDWRTLLRHFASSKELFPLPLESSYAAYLQRRAASKEPG